MFPEYPYGWRLDLATEMAIKAHGDQTWANGLPYKEHLRRVDENVCRFGKHLDAMNMLALRCAAWLHDTVEDTTLTVQDIETHFGEKIATLVWAVTDAPGKNRKERHAATYPKIKGTKNATLLKLCDRIANVDASVQDPKYMSMYLKEYPEFREALYVPGHNEEAWAHLDTLMSTVV